MSGDLDFTRLPTESDVIRVNNEISVTERKLQDLEIRLKMLKAWVAPIRRLNTDILALIFEMCGEDDWKTTLRISAISREWRVLVLSTPRAWEFLLVRENQDIMGVERYLERSSPRPLHLYLPSIHASSLLWSISQRLECLTLDHFYDEMTGLSFPKLKRFVITRSGEVPMSCIDTTRFPTLRHLVCIDYVTPFISDDTLNLPPLLSLTVTFDTHGFWLRVLQACQDTLISLELSVSEYQTTISRPQLVFPRLICLDIEDFVERSRAALPDLKTPILETYVEDTVHTGGRLMRPDTKTVTQLRTNRVPESFAFPKVKTIQFRVLGRARHLLRDLSSNPAHFPELETIEVVTSSKAPNDIFELVETVNRKRERTISLDCTSKFRDLRGMVKTQLCGSNMPCNYDW